jgi:plastocyanin
MKKRALLVISACMVGVLAVSMLGQATAFAQQGTTRIIRIWRLSSDKKVIIVEPAATRVLEGAVVVWWNKGGEQARVRFLNGEKCELRSSSPTGFVLEGENCYQTTYMKPGAISSLKFDEEGTYEFEVEIKEVGIKKGAVIVSKQDKSK